MPRFCLSVHSTFILMIKQSTVRYTIQIIGPLLQAAVFQSVKLMSMLKYLLFINLEVDNNVGMFFSVCLLTGLLLSNIRMFYKSSSCYFSGLFMAYEQINYLHYYPVICCSLSMVCFMGLPVLCNSFYLLETGMSWYLESKSIW